MPLYVFRCPEGHGAESIRPYDTETIPCPRCGMVAARQPVFGTGFVVEPAAVPRDQQRHDLTLFKEATAERAYYHERAEASAERSLPSRNLWKTAVHRARAGQQPRGRA